MLVLKIEREARSASGVLIVLHWHVAASAQSFASEFAEL
jgi:hypothetical protein